MPGAGTLGGRAANRLPTPVLLVSVRDDECGDNEVYDSLVIGPDIFSISSGPLSLLSLSLVQRLFCSVEAGRPPL